MIESDEAHPCSPWCEDCAELCLHFLSSGYTTSLADV